MLVFSTTSLLLWLFYYTTTGYHLVENFNSAIITKDNTKTTKLFTIQMVDHDARDLMPAPQWNTNIYYLLTVVNNLYSKRLLSQLTTPVN